MEQIQIETVVQQNGRIVIDNLPFDEGDTVEVIVSERTNDKYKKPDPNSLRGTIYRYDDPFEPAAPLEDWEVLK